MRDHCHWKVDWLTIIWGLVCTQAADNKERLQEWEVTKACQRCVRVHSVVFIVPCFLSSPVIFALAAIEASVFGSLQCCNWEVLRTSFKSCRCRFMTRSCLVKSVHSSDVFSFSTSLVEVPLVLSAFLVDSEVKANRTYLLPGEASLGLYCLGVLLTLVAVLASPHSLELLQTVSFARADDMWDELSHRLMNQ